MTKESRQGLRTVEEVRRGVGSEEVGRLVVFVKDKRGRGPIVRILYRQFST